MGCNQSAERRGASAPANSAAPASEPAAQPPQEPMVVVAPEPTVTTAEPASEVPVAAPAPVACDDVAAAPACDVPCAQPPCEEPAAPAEPTVPVADCAVAPQPKPVAAVVPVPQEPLSASVPALKLPARRSSVAKRAKTPTPRSGRSQKENAVAKAKTPSKPAGRGLSVATPNKAATVVLEPKKVSFDPVPAQESKAVKTKKNAKKVAGKHGCNVNEELFLASIAAFERQLTHRSSLDSQLNSR